MKARLIGCSLALVVAAGCGGDEKAPGPAAGQANKPAEAAAVAPSAGMAITEENLQRYIVYLTEMAPITISLMSEGSKATPDRATLMAMQKKSDDALSKSGLSLADMNSLGSVVGEFCGQWMVTKSAEEALAKIERNKTNGATGHGDTEMEGVFAEVLAGYKTFRAGLVSQHGETAVALLEKYGDQLHEAITMPMKAANLNQAPD